MNAVVMFFKSELGKLLLWVLISCFTLGAFFVLGYYEGKQGWKAKYEAVVSEAALVARLQAEAWVEQAARIRAEQDGIVKDLKADIDALEEREMPIKVVVKEVTKYVTKEADAVCAVPAGFKWMYNESLDLPTNSKLAGSRPTDVDAPTGITLSRVATVSASNNAECAARGEIIESWQKWYLQNKSVFERLAPVPDAAR